MEITRQAIYRLIDFNEEPSKAAHYYNRVMIVSIFLSLLPLTTRHNYAIFRDLELLCCGIFVIDYLLRWLTADLRSRRKGLRAFLLYPFTFGAIIDLLSILPVVSAFSSSLKVFRVYRLLRLFLIIRIFRVYEPLQIMYSVFRKERAILLTVTGFAVFYILLTALFAFNVEEVNPTTGKYVFDNFFDALYWATCTLTTVGYGDLYPITEWGRLISMISSLVGIAIIALPSGIITAAYMNELKVRQDKKEKEA